VRAPPHCTGCVRANRGKEGAALASTSAGGKQGNGAGGKMQRERGRGKEGGRGKEQREGGLDAKNTRFSRKNTPGSYLRTTRAAGTTATSGDGEYAAYLGAVRTAVLDAISGF
jgi:hypothetical protein